MGGGEGGWVKCVQCDAARARVCARTRARVCAYARVYLLYYLQFDVMFLSRNMLSSLSTVSTKCL